MIFHRHNVKPVANASERMLKNHLHRLNMFGNSRYAHITDEEGNWLQVGGGRLYCFLERHDTGMDAFYRGWRTSPLDVPFPDPVDVTIDGGRVSVRKDEWFRIEEVIQIFVAFRNQRALPQWVCWKDISELVRRNMT